MYWRLLAKISPQSYQLLIVGGFQRWLEISSCGLLQGWYIGTAGVHCGGTPPSDPCILCRLWGLVMC